MVVASVIWQVAAAKKLTYSVLLSMKPLSTPMSSRPQGSAEQTVSVPILIGQVYESAPPSLRARMLEHLMRPVGILGLLAVANGVFARIRLQNSAIEPNIGLDDISTIAASDVVKLADWVQQVSIDAIDGLTQLVSASPVLSKSYAAVVLLSLLMQRANNRNPV